MSFPSDIQKRNVIASFLSMLLRLLHPCDGVHIHRESMGKEESGFWEALCATARYFLLQLHHIFLTRLDPTTTITELILYESRWSFFHMPKSYLLAIFYMMMFFIVASSIITLGIAMFAHVYEIDTYMDQWFCCFIYLVYMLYLIWSLF